MCMSWKDIWDVHAWEREVHVVWYNVSTDTLQTKQNLPSYQTAGRPGCRHCSLDMFIEFAV